VDVCNGNDGGVCLVQMQATAEQREGSREHCGRPQASIFCFIIPVSLFSDILHGSFSNSFGKFI